MLQFTCQYPGCKAVFVANPGALDHYLSHIECRRKEEAVAGKAVGQRHTYDPDERALAKKPNSYYKPPNPLDEVPLWLGCVIAPPVYHHSRNPGDNVQNLLYAGHIGRSLRGRFARQWSALLPLLPRSATGPTPASLALTKSSSSRRGSRQKVDSDQASTSSQSTHYTPVQAEQAPQDPAEAETLPAAGDQE